jgi:hypothetical protein
VTSTLFCNDGLVINLIVIVVRSVGKENCDDSHSLIKNQGQVYK